MMVSFIPPPDPRSLLPPLLACLPTAFASARPPPALLPLLSPILRQRVHLLSDSDNGSASKSWLSLLCWESSLATELVDIVSESDAFELHPVSGELDYGEVEAQKYRRLDEETLQAKMELFNLGITIIYLWCESDDVDGGNGWKVAEVQPLKAGTMHGTSPWYYTISQANEKAKEKTLADAITQGERLSVGQNGHEEASPSEQTRDDDDDDYWARYDATPAARSSKAKPSPAPPLPNRRPGPNTSESDYFARYGDVQPQMDNDDPSEDRADFGESTLNGEALSSLGSTEPPFQETQDSNHSNGNQVHPDGLASLNGINQPVTEPNVGITAIRPIEGSVDPQLTSETAIKQHVSSTMKSLFRLCKTTGMEIEEFGQLVRTELDILGMISESES